VQTGDSISYTVIVLLLASASIVIFSYKRKDNKLE
jgi:LPXTG-motif cell wall-anchored protein